MFLLHARSLKEGVQISLTGGNFNNMVGEVDMLRDSEVRIRQTVNDLTFYRDKLRDFLEHNGQILDPVQRINVDFGWRVINNSTWELEFWTRDRELRGHIAEVIETLDYTIKSKTQAAT